jgi:hypothetical protein
MNPEFKIQTVVVFAKLTKCVPDCLMRRLQSFRGFYHYYTYHFRTSTGATAEIKNRIIVMTGCFDRVTINKCLDECLRLLAIHGHINSFKTPGRYRLHVISRAIVKTDPLPLLQKFFRKKHESRPDYILTPISTFGVFNYGTAGFEIKLFSERYSLRVYHLYKMIYAALNISHVQKGVAD